MVPNENETYFIKIFFGTEFKLVKVSEIESITGKRWLRLTLSLAPQELVS